MSDSKRPLKVFLCHAHADRDPVRGLYTRLTKDGVDAWLDKAKLLPGQDWELEIRKAVRESDVVVVCLSNQFNQAGFRQKEVRLALDTAMEQPEGEIFIIPARLEECESLESLRKWHWVDLFEDDGYEMLMRALRARADKIGVALQVKSGWLPNVTAFQVKGDKSKEITFESPKSENKKTKSSLKTNKAIVVALIGLVAIIIATLICSPIIGKWFSPLSVPTEMMTFTPTTSETTNVQESITEITDAKGVKMALVPAGEFTMGSNNGETDEQPVHTVYLDAFYIDVYEVTNASYKACVEAGVCDRLPYGYNYVDDPTYAQYPVVYLNWNSPKKYCEWRGAQLPTEAQWEKAARGTDGRIYPWGNEFDVDAVNFCDKNCSVVEMSDKNSDDGFADASPVGSYPKGVSPYGVYDMAGNVWEWVADWYSETYYTTYLIDKWPANPIGPEGSYARGMRGGSYLDRDFAIRTTYRSRADPSIYFGFNGGFRCAKDVP